MPNSSNFSYKNMLKGVFAHDRHNAKLISIDTEYTRFFYKKLGSAPSTKSFLISHENFATIVLKVS